MLDRFSTKETAKRQCDLRGVDISVKGGTKSIMSLISSTRVSGRSTP